jgi:uncharacterized lipoprotein YddW (UPF0748 family)
MNYTCFLVFLAPDKGKMRVKILISLILFLTFATVKAETLPKPEREFRAVWIATVDNIDFPTRKNLSVEEQKAELLRDLELAESLKMNAVVFQVRPMCDAIYQSRIEPWSEFLTGEMGKAQRFDPLKFITAEAHKRGILVHAWFNPYRAFHPAAGKPCQRITSRNADRIWSENTEIICGSIRPSGKFKNIL